MDRLKGTRLKRCSPAGMCKVLARQYSLVSDTNPKHGINVAGKRKVGQLGGKKTIRGGGKQPEKPGKGYLQRFAQRK